MTQNATGLTSYSKVASVGLNLVTNTRTPSNTDLAKLKVSLRQLLAKHPQGIPLSKARRFCPLLLHPEVLKDHASVLQLLQSMPDVVRLQGCGVQTIVLPTTQK